MRFTTASGSIYEADTTKKQIRRLIGVKDPQPRQGKDGEWRSFLSLDCSLHHPAVILWNKETTPLLDGSPEGAVPATITSVVVNIEVESVPS